MSQQQRLNLIGGFQSSPSTFECLFYQRDSSQTQVLFRDLYIHNLVSESWGTDEVQLKQIENIIQDIHNEHNGVLRCILTVENPLSQNKNHMMVFVI